MLKLVLLSTFISIALISSVVSDSNLGQQPQEPQGPDLRIEASTDALNRATSMYYEIVEWLSSNFELPPARSPPNIQFASQVELMKIRAADRPLWQGVKYEDYLTNVSNVVAVYDTVKATIYLPLGWTGNLPRDQSILVHETVHHLQNIAKIKHECPAAREKIAYLAQDAWLRRSNLSLEGEFGVDMFTIVALSACM